RVHGTAVDADLEVQVRPGRVAGVAGVADHLALRDVLADRHADRRLVAVARRQAAAVVDAGVVPVAADPPGDRDRPGVGGAQRRAVGQRDVDAGVQTPPALAEARADRPVRRPD